MKRANKIPDEYLPYDENDRNIKEVISQIGGFIK